MNKNRRMVSHETLWGVSWLILGENNQTLGMWHDNPEYVGSLDECTTIDTAISKKCKSLLQKGMGALDGTYGQIAVIDANLEDSIDVGNGVYDTEDGLIMREHTMSGRK